MNATDAAVRIPAADLLTVLTVVVAAVVVLLAIIRRALHVGRRGVRRLGRGRQSQRSLLAVVNQALFVNPNPLDQERRLHRQ